MAKTDEDVILTQGQAKKLVKRGTDLADPALREQLTKKGATFSGRGRTGVRIPFSALVALDLVKEGADPHNIPSTPASTRSTDGATNEDVTEAEKTLASLLREQEKNEKRADELRDEVREAKKAVTAAKRAAEREASKQAKAVEREEKKIRDALAKAEAKEAAAAEEAAALRFRLSQ